MADGEDKASSRFHDLDTIRALVLDPQVEGQEPVQDRLIDIGFQEIVTCPRVEDLSALLEEHDPDLLLLDVDRDTATICAAIKEIRSHEGEAGNPFAVILGVTGSGERAVVAAALEAGVDDLVAEPLTAAALRACITGQIENRKAFIATDDYVGPDHRPEEREPDQEELVSVEVPNTLRQKATGESAAEPVEVRVAKTMRSLGSQRTWHLSKKIQSIAERVGTALATGGDFPLLGESVEEIEETLGRIEALNAEYGFAEIDEMIVSTRIALEVVNDPAERVTARHFELLRVHGESIGFILKQSDECKEVLVTELERAVAAVTGAEVGPPHDAGAAGKEADDKVVDPRRSIKVRFRAWWDGVEPEEILEKQRSGS